MSRENQQVAFKKKVKASENLATKELREAFKVDRKFPDRLASRESSSVEFKESFNLKSAVQTAYLTQRSQKTQRLVARTRIIANDEFEQNMMTSHQIGENRTECFHHDNLNNSALSAPSV